MLADRLYKGDTIGIISPCMNLEKEWLTGSVAKLTELGFKIKYAKNVFKNTYGFAATEQERAEDFNSMIADPDVKMILFGGGEVCHEILPYLDYYNVRRNPKILCSFSDSTTLLNVVYSKTGLVTFYGPSVGTFDNINDFNLRQFERWLCSDEFLKHDNNRAVEHATPWKTIRGGKAEGTLIGGYLLNCALLYKTDYVKFENDKKYIFFLEDHECFSPVSRVSNYLTYIEEAGVFEHASGVIFGNYANHPQPEIEEILERKTAKYGIPVIKCDDFGHGAYTSILPIGVHASLDADKQTLILEESPVK